MRSAPRLAAATVAAACALAPAAARAYQPPVIAVFDLRDGSGLSPEQVDQLTTYLGARLAEGTVFSVVPRAQLKAALDEQKKTSLEACYDEACQIEIGKEVSASKAVLSDVVRLTAEQCALTGTLFDLRAAASELATTEKVSCDPAALVAGLDRLSASLKAHSAMVIAAGHQRLGASREALEAVDLAIAAKPEHAEAFVLRASLRVALAAPAAVIEALATPDGTVRYPELRAALVLAVSDLERYLRLQPDAHDRALVEARLEQVRGWVRATEQNEAALAAQQRQQAEAEVARRTEAQRESERVTAVRARYQDELAAARSGRTLGWLFTGGALALGAGAGAFAFLGGAQNDAVRAGGFGAEGAIEDAASAGSLHNGLAIACAALGGAALSAGLTFLLTHFDPETPAEAAP
jgi:hypothetical protein